MSNSFYGGRDGQPFVVKKRYETIAAMLEEFQMGPGFTEVNFGEYVIIDTINRNNPENGRIFKRGYDYNSTRTISSWQLDKEENIFKEDIDTLSCGAVYIGQIVGPSGNAPHLNMLSTENDVVKQYEDNVNKPGYDVKTGTGLASTEAELANLIPGKDGEIFNDNITWTYCSIRDENERSTEAYIGFTIPYTVIEFEADSVSAYYNRSNDTADFSNEDLVDRLDDATHPFHEKWQINIPKGIHGQSIENLRVDVDEEGREVLKYEFRNYDAKPEGETQTIELGDYNMIDSITIDDNGTITIDYSHDDNSVWEQLLTWITGIQLNTDNGQLDIDTNNGKNELHTNLTWVKDIQLSDTGYLDIETTTENNETHKQLQWVKDITFDENGTVVLHYIDGTNSGDTYKNLVDWIKSVNIAQDGTVTIISNNGTEFLVNQNKLKWVSGVSLAQDGTFTTSYNNGDAATVQDVKLKWATNIQIADNGQVSTSYNDGTSVDGPKLDWIKSAILDSEKNLKIDYVNAADIDVPLKTVQSVNLDTGILYATYNTGITEPIGPLSSVSSCAGPTADENLGIGGLWFITEE